MNVVSELIFLPIGSLIMTKISLHAAMISSISLEFSGLFILLMIPETLHCKREATAQPIEDATSLSTDGQAALGAVGNEVTPIKSYQEPTSKYTTRDRLHSTRKLLAEPIKLVCGDKYIPLGLPAFSTSRFLHQVVYLLVQYVSKKLDWTIASVSSLRFINIAS